jgi:hypothetical protein
MSPLAAPSSVVLVDLLPHGGGAGIVAPMGGAREHPAWPAGLDVPASLWAAPPSMAPVDPLVFWGGAGAAGPMGGTRGNTVDQLF